AVEKDAIIHIRKNARAKISSDGFIGNRIVVIYGGTPAQPAVGSGDYLVSESGITTDDILGTLQDNNKNLLEITGNLKEVTEKIRDGKGTLGNLVNSSSVANNLNNTLQHIKNASARTEETIGLLKDFAEGLSKEGGLAHELVNDTTVFTSIKQTTTRLRQVTDTLSVFSDNIKNASGALGRNDNAAGTILNDKQIAEDLKRITENLRYGSEKLDEDLIALQHNFLLKGYFKKQEKEKNKQPAAKDTLPH
ncbi:MAG TPA: hypothetical protein VMI35_12935, partial [Puia sp.]|nr:hypothetical protein [Puia sp.]